MKISKLPDIKPQSPIVSFDRDAFKKCTDEFTITEVAPVLGMNPSFIRKATGKKKNIDASDLLSLLDQDVFAETFVPRSRILSYLTQPSKPVVDELSITTPWILMQGNALDLIPRLPSNSIRCVVTSTPYWALRIYKESHFVSWADGECCPYGHEQTPEGFLRHTAEILFHLSRVLKDDGSIWWNIMDSYNTRTQIRGNAAEALRAMQGKDRKSWNDHECRRYSSGHVFLKDGEQCLIPSRIAERASRMGYFVKTSITWAKTSSLPEPQNSRVSRNLEYVLHLTKQRTPRFDKSVYRQLPPQLGGRNNGNETDKLSDVWTLPTSSGRDGHGAQFPIALPARCISLTTTGDDLVLDPFVGSGNAGVAALALGRRFIGFDVSRTYLELAKKRIQSASYEQPIMLNTHNHEPTKQEPPL
ncbi:site-specific DNA-methyltransferase [Celeribacter halophilus]|uniref:Methyltransferase n=1 Tax=Celeribacter halophilus TaxID=576117 RepID=A0AAW7XPM0_9RHOB|nr:site-specific DNA-methyltransferase [Celeribacter halophilus]MDO6456287.1 site-specific DNA-methyltransferase [Celeribacter halophilus]